MGVIVTTPQLVSMGDALKGIAAFEQLKIPIIGVIENMGPYTDPKTGTKVALFGEGGGERLAALKKVPFLGISRSIHRFASAVTAASQWW